MIVDTLLAKVIGTANDRELKRIRPFVAEINSKEPEIQRLSDEQLRGKTVAILVAHGFEQSELTDPKKALEQAGAITKIVSPERKEVKGWKHTEWGDTFQVVLSLAEAHASEFDALLLPGGVMNPDKLRLERRRPGDVRNLPERVRVGLAHERIPEHPDADLRHCAIVRGCPSPSGGESSRPPTSTGS